MSPGTSSGLGSNSPCRRRRARLVAAVERGIGRAIAPDLLALLAPCYLAFRIGAGTMAAAAASPEEAGRLARAVAADTERLRARLRQQTR